MTSYSMENYTTVIINDIVMREEHINKLSVTISKLNC